MIRIAPFTKIFTLLLSLGIGLSVDASETVPPTKEQAAMEMAKIVNKSVEFLKLETDPKKRQQIITKKIYPMIVPKIDFVSFTKAILGKHRRKLSTQQIAQLTDLTKELLLHVYGSAFLKFDNQSIVIAPSRPLKRKDRMEFTMQIIGTEADAKPLTVDYKMRLVKAKESSSQSFPARWLVYDLVIENISLALSYKNNIDDLVNQKGIDSLVKVYKSKVDKIK